MGLPPPGSFPVVKGSPPDFGGRGRKTEPTSPARVEPVSGLRGIQNLDVIRPADPEETRRRVCRGVRANRRPDTAGAFKADAPAT